MSQALSAIVIIVDDDVHSVYIVPVAEATTHNMTRLRDQIRASGVKGVRVQRVWYSDTDRTVHDINDISKRLNEVLVNHDY